MTIFKRWRANKNITKLPEPITMEAQIDKAPIIMAAVDLSPDMEKLADRLLFAVRRMLVIQPDARVACINVLKTARLGIDITVDAQGNNLHVQRLVGLKHWARGLNLPEERITFSVLEHTDPANAIIEYASNNHVDHIMMGARGHSTTRRYLGSVSSQVVAEAPCSVTVIRIPQEGTVFAARASMAQDGQWMMRRMIHAHGKPAAPQAPSLPVRVDQTMRHTCCICRCALALGACSSNIRAQGGKHECHQAQRWPIRKRYQPHQPAGAMAAAGA